MLDFVFACVCAVGSLCLMALKSPAGGEENGNASNRHARRANAVEQAEIGNAKYQNAPGSELLYQQNTEQDIKSFILQERLDKLTVEELNKK